MVFLLHKLMGASQGEIHVSFLVQSSPFALWVFDIVLETLAFSVICRNFTLRNIPCSLVVMLEISLREACTGYEGAYTELRALLNTQSCFPHKSSTQIIIFLPIKRGIRCTLTSITVLCVWKRKRQV